MANWINPYDYLVAVIKNPHAVKADPGRWLPWNYQKTVVVQTSRFG